MCIVKSKYAYAISCLECSDAIISSERVLLFFENTKMVHIIWSVCESTISKCKLHGMRKVLAKKKTLLTIRTHLRVSYTASTCCSANPIQARYINSRRGTEGAKRAPGTGGQHNRITLFTETAYRNPTDNRTLGTTTASIQFQPREEQKSGDT